MSKQNIPFALVGAAFVGILWAGVHFLAPSDSNVLRGNFTVLYDTTNRTGTITNGSGLNDVSAIRLCPGYVVVEQQNGDATVFFSEYTQKLSWNQVDVKAERK